MTYEYPTNFTYNNASTVVEGLGTLFQYMDHVTDGWFPYGMLLIIFVMTFMVGVMISPKRAFASSFFITFIFSVYFARLDMVAIHMPIVFIIGIIIALAFGRDEGRY